MYFVYFLRSESKPDKTYIGYTKCLVNRISQHNAGLNIYTRRYKPWKVESFILAETKQVAKTAEAYFKNSSGKEKFKPFADQENPIEAFFGSQETGRIFGKSSFKIGNRIAMMTECPPISSDMRPALDHQNKQTQ